MAEMILFVDDDDKILEAFKREFGKQYSIKTALSGEQALEIIDQDEPFAIIIADIRMPRMDGIRFLSKARELTPNSVRIVLTGTADMQTAIHAVNQGQVFRFLTKPCPDAILRNSLEAGIKQYHLIIAEKELLEKTLVSSVKIMTEVLSLVSPSTFSKATRLRRIVVHIVQKMALEDAWQYELAAALSQIGLIVFPPAIMEKINSRVPLSHAEKMTFAKHPIVGSELLKNIPRLELIARMIKDQELPLQDLPLREKTSKDDYVAAMGAHLIKVAIDYDNLVMSGIFHTDALAVLSSEEDKYQPEALAALDDLQPKDISDQIKFLDIRDLDVGMILLEDIIDYDGKLLVANNQEVMYPLLMRLFKLNESKRLTNKAIKVLVPK
jgi:response regulator RpfG family c-di-GMP phosphodiesterase